MQSSKPDSMQFYKSQGIRTMNRIEIISSKMMSEIAPDLETRFWAAYDTKDIKEMRRVYNLLTRFHDDITMD